MANEATKQNMIDRMAAIQLAVDSIHTNLDGLEVEYRTLADAMLTETARETLTASAGPDRWREDIRAAFVAAGLIDLLKQNENHRYRVNDLGLAMTNRLTGR